MVKKNYYQILGVTSAAEDVVIRAAYRALVQKYHPDKFAGITLDSVKRDELSNQVREIQEAYRVLSNPHLRAQFDKQNWAGLYSNDLSSSSWLEGLEAKSWQALVDHYPKFKNYFAGLELRQPEIAQEYKILLMELLSEGILANIIRKLTPNEGFVDVAKDLHASPSLNKTLDIEHGSG